MERASRPSSAAKLAEANSATNAVLIWNPRVFIVIGIFLVQCIMGIKRVPPCTFMQKKNLVAISLHNRSKPPESVTFITMVCTFLQIWDFAVRQDHVTVAVRLTPPMQKSSQRAWSSLLQLWTRQCQCHKSPKALLLFWGYHLRAMVLLFGDSFPWMFDNYCGVLSSAGCLCMHNRDKSSNMRSFNRFTICASNVLPSCHLSLLLKCLQENGSRAQFPDELVKAGGLKDGFLAGGARCWV